MPGGRPGPEGGVDHRAQSSTIPPAALPVRQPGLARLIVVGHRVSLVRRFSVALTIVRDVGSGCQPRRCAVAFATRRASALVLRASAGEAPPVGSVGALGVGDQPAQSSQGAGMRPQVQSRGHWNRHRAWRLSDPRQILVQHLREFGAIITVDIATAPVRCKQRS